MLVQILTDVPAFGEKTKGPMIIQRIAMGKKPIRADHPKIEEYDCSDMIWCLFEECWEMDPADRPSAGRVVQLLEPMLHRLLKSMRNITDIPISRTMVRPTSCGCVCYCLTNL
jgi:hypothetical protein